MTQDATIYHVWIGGSCDYGHKERAGGAAVDTEAMECKSEDYDVIIGMDVISQGDFAFTYANNESVFSFRLPAKEHIELKD